MTENEHPIRYRCSKCDGEGCAVCNFEGLEPLPAEEGGRPIPCHICGGESRVGFHGDMVCFPFMHDHERPASVVSSEEGGRGETDFARSMDARVWAREFMARFADRKQDIDEGLMLSWFANAIMAGFDEAESRHARPASVVGDASEGEAPCHGCGAPAKLVTGKRRGVWNSREWPDAPEVEFEDTRWECDSCGEAWYTAGQVDRSQLHLLRESLRSTRAALEATKDEFVQYRDEQDTRLREAQKDARQARAALEEARNEREANQMTEEQAYEARAILLSDDPDDYPRRIAIADSLLRALTRAIPSQESTKV